MRKHYGGCVGVGFIEENGEMDWREGCETCLRRTTPMLENEPCIDPPKIIAFECEYLIEPTHHHDD